MSVPLHSQVSVTGSAQPLAGSPVKATAFAVKAPLTNTAPVFIGSSTVTSGNGHQLDPGDGVDYEHSEQHGASGYVLNVSDFYVVGTAGDRVTWLATPIPA